MPVYNAEKYLKEAIESILNQTFRDFEFIIINDGSADGTADIIARYQQMDNRIRVYSQENKGIAASRNRGCQLARGEYIAVMDADDVSLPERLAKQTSYMETHPDIGVLGTWTVNIDENGKPMHEMCLPTAPGVLGWHLLFENCIANSSVMMRLDTIARLGFYCTGAVHAEDYELWTRAIDVTGIANLPETLLKHRIWEGSISFQRNTEMQLQTRVKIMHSAMVRQLGSDIPMEKVRNLRLLLINRSFSNTQETESLADLIEKLYKRYLKTHTLNRSEARDINKHAGVMLLTLSIYARKISIRERLVILTRGVRLSPRLLLSGYVVTKGFRKGMRMLLRRT